MAIDVYENFVSATYLERKMDRISPNLIYTFTLAIFRLGWLPVIFHKFVTELWRLINVFTAMNSAIVRFSDNFRCYAYVNILVVL